MSPLSINSAVTLQIPPGFHLSLYNSPNFLFSFFVDDITFTFPLQFTHFPFSLSQMISLHCNFQGFVFLCNLPMSPFHFLFLTFSVQLPNFLFFLYLQFFFLGFSFFLSAANPFFFFNLSFSNVYLVYDYRFHFLDAIASQVSFWINYYIDSCISKQSNQKREVSPTF